MGLGKNLGPPEHNFQLRIWWQRGPLFLLRTKHCSSNLNKCKPYHMRYQMIHHDFSSCLKQRWRQLGSKLNMVRHAYNMYIFSQMISNESSMIILKIRDDNFSLRAIDADEISCIIICEKLGMNQQ